MIVAKTNKFLKTFDLVILTTKSSTLEGYEFSEDELKYIAKKQKEDKDLVAFNNLEKNIYVVFVDDNKKKTYKTAEKLRKTADKISNDFNSKSVKNVLIAGTDDVTKYFILSFLEGFLLSNYTFNKYFTENLDKKQKSIETVKVLYNNVSKFDVEKTKIIIDSVFVTRDLVNEPFSGLNSVDLANRIKTLSEEAGFGLEVLNKKQIEALKMGGILGVNRASAIPPTFSILEWKPTNAKNEKPLVLVGKGIVFDSGGYNIKTGNYMTEMKSDMAGAATVIGIMHAVAKLKLPVHLICLVPSTDNLVGKHGYVPGDILKMYDGKTVEILNTDAEGRLILADALSYAKKYDPELVIDFATLTGAAARAIGDLASAMMGTAGRKVKKAMIKSGKKTYERVMEFPLWDEYGDMLKSNVADLQNIGGASAGHITAGKFLENFTAYPWLHIDIAPTAYLSNNSDFRGKGATGIPVRLLINFIENYI